MDIYYLIVFFLLGTVFGSFFMVVGDRLPQGKSIVKPRSHCDNCNHELTAIELIPIISYLIQKGKCKNCGIKLPITMLLFEVLSGVLFSVNYLVFKLDLYLIMSLTFTSLILIILVSDLKYMIISDEVIVVTFIILFISKLIIYGIYPALYSLLQAIISFIIMFLIKLLGDFLFKKESMGGGDIKLLFVFGFMLHVEGSLISIFLGSLVGLPISIIVMNKLKNNEIPFGPFLSIGALLVLFLKIDLNTLLKITSFIK